MKKTSIDLNMFYIENVLGTAQLVAKAIEQNGHRYSLIHKEIDRVRNLLDSVERLNEILQAEVELLEWHTRNHPEAAKVL